MHNPLFAALAMAAKARVKEITIAQAQQMLSQPEPPQVIDVREDQEWHAGHLPNAVHLSKGVIERDIEKVIPDVNTPLVLYCGGGYRSALAADNLQKMGYTNVYSMDGGITAWAKANYPLIKG